MNSFQAPPAQRNGFNNRKRSFGAHNSNHAAETKPEKKPKVATAPAVPAFGANFALPPRPDWPSAQRDSSSARPDWLSARGKYKNKNRGRKNNTLGLTPTSDVRSEPEEDIDEEAEFAKRVGHLEVLFVTCRLSGFRCDN